MQVLVLTVMLGFGLLAQDAGALSGSHLSLPGQFPYQALVEVVGSPAAASPCAGALVDASWVLTAAACVRPDKEEVAVKVTLGAYDLSLASEDSRVEHLCFDRIVHEGYNAATGDNDIALLRLSAPAGEDEFIRPIRLPSKAQAKDSFLLRNGAVSGWGNAKAGNQAPSNWVLRWFDSRVQPLFWCRLRNGAGRTVRDSDICLNSFWKRGTCTGDAGSPVAVTDWSGHATLIGIAPGGDAAASVACDNYKPPVFTRVTSYLDWISEHAHIQLREK